MKLIELSITRPKSVIVGVLLAVIFGVISLLQLPVQMKPTTDQPTISVRADYPGVAPQEIEDQITTPMEQRLNSVQNLTRITSRSMTGRSQIDLRFDWGIDKDLASIDVLKKLNQVRNLPLDMATPVITAATSDESAISYLAVESKTHDQNTLRQISEEIVAPQLERIEGVGLVRIFGGQEREIQVILDYETMTSLGISIEQVRTAIMNANRNVRGGHIDEGKRQYMVRTLGQFERLEDLEDVIVSQFETGSVYLRDIARVEDGFKEATTSAKERRTPVTVLPVVKRSGANAVKVMAAVDEVIEELNEELAFRDVEIIKVYDETDYIWDSINHVLANLELGGALACLLLLIFLRSLISTAIISLAIPVSIIASFIFLDMVGSSLNIITLAGLAFAVGMVVDNAIVVLENIYRHGEMGHDPRQASLVGTKQVWGAILASTLTTLAVFLPIVFVKEEVGQIFRDIALSISFAIIMSLVVSITMIPMLASSWMRSKDKNRGSASRSLDLLTLGWVGRPVRAFIIGSVEWLIRGVVRKLLFVLAVMSVFAVSLTYLPSAEYLPAGNMNVIFAGVRVPPGTNEQRAEYLMNQVEDRFMALEEMKYLFVMSGSWNACFLIAKEEFEDSLKDVVGKMRELVSDIPGIRIYVSQWGIFSRGGGSKSIGMRVKGKDLQEVQRYAAVLEERLGSMDGIISAQSSIDVSNPEFQIRIDRERAARLGLSVRTVAEAIETFVGGKQVSYYRMEGDEIDITLKSAEGSFSSVEDLNEILVHAPSGQPVRLGSVIQVRDGLGPTQIQHWNLDRVISVNAQLEETVPLEEMLAKVEREVAIPIMQTMPMGYTVEMGETADQLNRTKEALVSSFVLAVVIIYLLMTSLFESFRFPLIIMFSVPLSMTGAIFGIIVTNSQLNVITMPGFTILAGIVVNNAILLVHQALRLMREENYAYNQAIVEGCKTRIRPIFMSTLTSILGMLPLAAGSGAGSELYSGLGAAIVGGLTISMLFTLVLVPVLFSLFNDFGSRPQQEQVHYKAIS